MKLDMQHCMLFNWFISGPIHYHKIFILNKDTKSTETDEDQKPNWSSVHKIKTKNEFAPHLWSSLKYVQRQIKESDVILLALGRFEAPYLKLPWSFGTSYNAWHCTAWLTPQTVVQECSPHSPELTSRKHLLLDKRSLHLGATKSLLLAYTRIFTTEQNRSGVQIANCLLNIPEIFANIIFQYPNSQMDILISFWDRLWALSVQITLSQLLASFTWHLHSQLPWF
jgi:hypothetical protein